MAMLTKSFEDAVKACGGAAKAHVVLDRFLKAALKAKEDKALAAWGRQQQNRPTTEQLLSA